MASIQVSSWQLKQACMNFWVKYGKTNPVKQQLIEELVGKPKYGFFGPKHTYESAKHKLENSGMFKAYHLSEISFIGYRQKAKQFLQLAQHGDPVTLTDEDIWIMEYL